MLRMELIFAFWIAHENMQGPRSEHALLFCVVFAPELRCELQKSGRFRVEISARFAPLNMVKEQERTSIDHMSLIIDH
jgi:hypothetical protein